MEISMMENLVEIWTKISTDLHFEYKCTYSKWYSYDKVLCIRLQIAHMAFLLQMMILKIASIGGNRNYMFKEKTSFGNVSQTQGRAKNLQSMLKGKTVIYSLISYSFW